MARGRDWQPGWRGVLYRRLEEAAGVLLIGLAVCLLISLATWSPTDPSLNSATAGPVANWLGIAGAYLSDILMQTMGLAAYVLAVPLLGWGVRLVRHDFIALAPLRILTWMLGAILLAMGLSLLPMPAGWSLVAGLGGVIGDGVARGFAALMVGALTPGQITWGLIVSGFVLGVLLTGYAATIKFGHIGQSVRFVMRHLRREPSQETEETRSSRPQKTDKSGKSPDAGKASRKPKWEIGKRIVPALAALRPRNPFAREEEDETAKRVSATRERAEPQFRREPSAAQKPKSEPAAAKSGSRSAPQDEPPFGDEEEEFGAEDFSSNRIDRTQPKPKPSKRAQKEAQPVLPLASDDGFELPPLSLLSEAKNASPEVLLSDEALEQNARLLESVLEDFGIRGEIMNVRPGPVVTLYELEPAPGIKSARVIALAEDIARSMSAVSARVAVVPGRNVIGIELPNAKRETVYLRELLESSDYEGGSSKLALALGKGIGGEPVVTDLARMPHLLIAGTTGSGKSVGINAMILSLLYRMTPEQCRLIMVDPKMLELSIYDGIPHLLTPVVTDPKKAVVALKWAVKEMEDRYSRMSKVGVRNIDGFNQRVAEADETGETFLRTVQTGFDHETGKAIYEQEEITLERMPYIVVVVDEMADLMMVAGKEIEGAIQRLAQMARAAGIHMITATQRPSVDVITGTIKANFPTRISYQVTSKIDSRTILGEQGAEQLLGMGDMLFMAGGGRLRRVHAPFVSDEEVDHVVKFLKDQGTPEYLSSVTEEPADGGDMFGVDGGGEGSGDELLDKAIAIVARDRRASTSYVQRRLQIGYNRAARLIEMMEDQGVISGPNHAGKREVLVPEVED